MQRLIHAHILSRRATTAPARIRAALQPTIVAAPPPQSTVTQSDSPPPPPRPLSDGPARASNAFNPHLHLIQIVSPRQMPRYAHVAGAQLLPGFAVAVLNVPRLSPRRVSASFGRILISNLVSFDRHAISNVSMPHALRSSLLSAPLYSSLCPSLPLLPTPSLTRL